ncbi:MAG: site-specific integrase, partial [Gemmatimonadota bacterium]|nr:site-specific integrase [Gemmatimonadota bacterium]
TAAEGFPRGTVVFLDVERMEFTPKAMRDYYKEWVARVLADGRFTPGIYAHVHNAPLIYRDVKSLFEAAGRTDEPPFWVAGGRNFSPTKAPHEVGHTFAAVWQGVLDVVQEWSGHKVKIDVNVAQTPSPSLYGVQAD